MPQERKAPSRKSAESSASEEAGEVAQETDVSERKEALDDDIDAILDEIDEVLESNAEDFVKSFIQKGGQ
jgi:ubiquitin-like protein Pup